MSLSTQPLSSLDWGTKLSGSTVTYAFGAAGTSTTVTEEYSLGAGYTAEGFNAFERAQFRAAFDVLESVTNLSFVQTNTYSTADFRLLLDTNQFFFDDLGAMVPPGEPGEGIGVFNGAYWDRSAGGDLEQGGYSFTTIIHELMHGLGLSHPHDTGGGSATIMTGVTSAFDDYGTYQLNQGVYTAMSYNTGLHTGPVGAHSTGFTYGYETGPMALDIAVLQEKYGANTTHASGANVYYLPTANTAGTGWTSIWDTGGVDILRYLGSSDATLDLRAATLQDAVGGGGYLSAADGIQGGFTIAHGVEIERADGSHGNDRLIGNAFDNTLLGNGGSDTLLGNAGADQLYGGNGADTLKGGSDNDLLRGNTGNDRLEGEAGNDILFGDIGADRLIGGDGNDQLYGGGGADKLFGGDGDDTLKGTSGTDIFYGNAGADRIEGGTQNDWMKAGTQDDVLIANGGDDTLFGEAGNDSLYSGAGNDRAYGGSGDDVIKATSGANVLYGNLGHDLIEGGSGADYIAGGNNNDTITGGMGNDTLKGEGGNDTFVFAPGFDTDSIRDLAGNDVLRIDDGLLSGQGTGAAVVAAFGTAFNSRYVLDFGNGDVLTLDGITDAGYLAGVIDIF